MNHKLLKYFDKEIADAELEIEKYLSIKESVEIKNVFAARFGKLALGGAFMIDPIKH